MICCGEKGRNGDLLEQLTVLELQDICGREGILGFPIPCAMSDMQA